MIRIGQSSDIHKLVKNRKLIIGGVEIPHYYGLLGHSDADVLCHAIGESIIGAMGLGDLGKHFPDNAPEYLNISSLILLEKIKEMLLKNGYRIINIDSLIMIEKPKMSNFISSMRENIANSLAIKPSQVNIKATTGEGLSFIGHEEGVMAQAVVLLDNIEG